MPDKGDTSFIKSKGVIASDPQKYAICLKSHAKGAQAIEYDESS